MKLCALVGFTAHEVESEYKSFSCCCAPLLQSDLAGREVKLIVLQHVCCSMCSMVTSVRQPNSSHELAAAVPMSSFTGWVISFTQRLTWDYVSMRLQLLLLCTPEGGKVVFSCFSTKYMKGGRRRSFLSSHVILCEAGHIPHI